MSRTDAKRRMTLGPLGALALALGLSLAGPATAVADDEPDFTVSPQAPVAGQTVTFTATDTKASDSLLWDFENDGTFDATGTAVQHVYATAGERTVLMRVQRPRGQPKDVRKTVRVAAPSTTPPSRGPGSPPSGEPGSPANQPPVASFAFYPHQPLSGDSVEFISTSSDAESPIAGHAWDLDGDGHFDDSSGVTAARSFSAPGDYTVALRVIDANGAADVESRTITVGARLVSSSTLGLMSPFPVVRIIGRSAPAGARIKLLVVRSAPRGARVTVRCRGEGCRRRRAQSRVARTGRLRFRSFERLLGAGARIQIFVTQPGRIGKYTSFKIRRTRPPLRRDLCVRSVTAKPERCPSS